VLDRHYEPVLSMAVSGKGKQNYKKLSGPCREI
jgi:hypothetical protein